jgi:la-related protein 1
MRQRTVRSRVCVEGQGVQSSKSPQESQLSRLTDHDGRLERSSSQLSIHPAQVARLSYHDGNMPVFWNKDGAQLMESAHDGVAWEPYDSLRNRALEQRLYGDTSATMESLYKFWSHFLIRNFNVRMYDEFHTLALEDSSQGLSSGVSHLVRYFEALLSGQTPLTDRHANGLVQLVQSESDGPRPAFHILRTAWRNGAFNLKSRKRIDTIITPTLRAELEK